MTGSDQEASKARVTPATLFVNSNLTQYCLVLPSITLFYPVLPTFAQYYTILHAMPHCSTAPPIPSITQYYSGLCSTVTLCLVLLKSAAYLVQFLLHVPCALGESQKLCDKISFLQGNAKRPTKFRRASNRGEKC